MWLLSYVEYVLLHKDLMLHQYEAGSSERRVLGLIFLNLKVAAASGRLPSRLLSHETIVCGGSITGFAL